MKWKDYREALGIGFNDTKCEQMFVNKVKTIFDMTDGKVELHIEKQIALNYFNTVGEAPYDSRYYFSRIWLSVKEECSTIAIISKMIAFINSCTKIKFTNLAKFIKELLLEALDDLNMQFELYEDDDGIFLFPKGAKELDNELISMPYEWLKKYPKARDAMAKALLQYSQGNDPSNIADLFRKALETFYQEFFGKSNSLEKIKSDFGQYLKEKGVPKEISGNLETVLQLYTKFNNNYAKHHDDTSENVLEFIMYQTGNLIRLIITLEK